MRYLVMVLAIGASPATLSANGLIAQPHVTGAGAGTCAAFVRQAGPDGLSDPASLQWVLGYLTGRTAATNAYHRPFSGPEGIALDLLAYCRAHPYRQLNDAAASFFERTRRCSTVRGCR